MNFKKNSYGGGRPVFVNPPALVLGGFELDIDSQNFTEGAVIPAGTLAIINETTRKVSILKSARLTAIDAEDAKIVTVENNEFLSNPFTIGDLVHVIAAEGENPAVEVTVSSVSDGVITLSAEISGLTVGDIITEKVNSEGTAALIGSFNGVVIAEIKVQSGVNGIDVSKDAVLYANRVLPVPSSLVTNDYLTVNPHIRYTDSL